MSSCSVILGEKAKPAAGKLLAHLHDSSPGVSLACAESLCRIGHAEEALPVLVAALNGGALEARIQAANILEHLGEIARPVLPAMKAALDDGGKKGQRAESYPDEMLRHAVELLK